jgi:site-specific recombinase XerC
LIPLSINEIRRLWNRIAAPARSTVDHVLHALRHTAAYRMAEDPALPLTDVQFVLGHAQLTTTQIYMTAGVGMAPSPGISPPAKHWSWPLTVTKSRTSATPPTGSSPNSRSMRRCGNG